MRLAAIAAAESVVPQLKDAFRSNMDIEFKRDRRDIVTVHDKTAEVAICAHLSAAVPDSSFVGEEGGVWGAGRIQWFIDPIDGTANFARGLPSWCISIGAVCEDQIVVGVIVDPMGGNVFSADLMGAYHDEVPLWSNGTSDEGLATILCSYPSARDIVQDGRDVALDRFGELVETYSAVRRIGSAALGLAHVAAGWADGAANFSINAWDITGGILILRQAGGQFLPLEVRLMPAGAPDHTYPAYVALGAGAECPRLIAMAAEIADQRRRM
ncbi:MAG: inositol monophosphatase family protein [Paracoccaceae bacterium]|nr:inositol monophosphatase family protein [Paracoccaceae bacterium]